MPEDKVLLLLEAADWKDIIKKLTHHANWRASLYTWKSGSSYLLPSGKTPEDVALEAVGKILSGTRYWDPDKYPDLLAHLKWIVKSDISHLFSSEEHQKSVRMPETKDSGKIKPDILESGSLLNSDGKTSTPEEELIAHEDRDFEERIKRELYSSVEDNDDLGLLLLCFEEGIDKPAEIAEKMGWDVTKVYNLKRTLLRRVSKIMKEFSA